MSVQRIGRDCLRPNASDGLWLSALIPLCYALNVFKYADSVEFQYKITALVASSLLWRSVAMFRELRADEAEEAAKEQPIASVAWYAPVLEILGHRITQIAAVAAFLVLQMQQTIPFSLVTAICWPTAYRRLYTYTLRQLPGNFTLGECSIVCQAAILVLLNAALRLIDYSSNAPQSEAQQMSVIVLLTLLGTGAIITILLLVRPYSHIAFYPASLLCGALVMAFPVTAEATAIECLWHFIFGSVQRLCALLVAAGLLGVTGSGVAWFVQRGGRSSTRTRKWFHALIVLVFVPGLLWQCTLLQLAAGMMMAAFALLEAARLVQLWPVAAVLRVAVATFLDEQDASGRVALTPIYLLAGCAMPMWLHPCACNLADWPGAEALMAMCAGVMSVGVGDAAASVCGSLWGRHKWRAGGIKSIEGTVASVLAQALFVPLFVSLGVFRPTPLRLAGFAVAIVTNSVVEAKLDQIDNLVLPLVTYAILTVV